MITFLVVTSIINLALGYALAVYLGGATALSYREAQAVHLQPAAIAAAKSASATVQPETPWSAESVVASAPAVHLPAGGKPGTLATSPIIASPPAAEATELHTRTAEMEQDLLAGIEEFRNQLAQLKGQSIDGLVQNPFAAEPVGVS